MNKLISAFGLTIILSICAFAQNSGDEFKRNEYFVGYSNQQVDTFGRATYNGVEAGYVRNIHRYFGIKGDFSAAYRKNNFSGNIYDPVTGAATVSFNNKNTSSLYNFLGGVQIKDNASKARFKPFAHALAGIAYNRFDSNITCASAGCGTVLIPGNFKFSDTGFSAALGGGLDIKINDKIDFRAIQVDYNPIRTNGQWNNNVRFGIGFVFK